MKTKQAVFILFPGVFVGLSGAPAIADCCWDPEKPITIHIGFKAGGGTDTQARLIGEELSKKKGWKFVYKNVAGKGGANLARRLKNEPGDGYSIGMAVSSTFSYNPLLSKRIGYNDNDFEYIISTAPTQMGLVVRKDSGWKNMDEVIDAAGRKRLKFAVMSPRLRDAAHVISKKFGIKFNVVRSKGGRGVMNGLMAKDVDIGFIAGIQAKPVQSGHLVNIASAEKNRLTMSPNAPTLIELGIPYEFGVTFVVFGPKNLNPKAKYAIATGFKEVLRDPKSKARAFVLRAFGVPPLKTGAELSKQISDEVVANRKILSSIK